MGSKTPIFRTFSPEAPLSPPLSPEEPSSEPPPQAVMDRAIARTHKRLKNFFILLTSQFYKSISFLL